MHRRTRRALISIATALLCSLSVASALQTTTQLPRTVLPTHYAVSLVPNAENSSFTSKVDIRIDVVKPTSSITLNASHLAIQNVVLRSHKEEEARKISLNEEEQTATFEFARKIPVGTYTLSIDYSGVIGKQANGLFSIDYDTPVGRSRAIYTQFENSDARRFIPSWDEPNYKATFALNVIVPSNEMVVSNMPIASKTALPDGRSHVQFGVTPKMSTYLLFFGLGEFERATDKAGDTEIGVITKKGSLPQARFLLDASKEILPQYNDYFGVRYPLPKLDNVAAPGSSQFFSAMENWGAIFTFEHRMLLDPSISTQIDKERIFAVVAHEMAHQWFGDLVTMRWWDDLWLNEGFASWMESRITQQLHPEWNTKLAMVDSHESAMAMDALSTTHPIVQRIDTVEQASQAFDGITYSKGESVIHMLENYVGADKWRDGVRIYMKTHAYGNTTSDDFWRAIEKASDKPVKAIAHDFTLQPGIPLITVSDVSCKAGKSIVSLKQSEYSRDHINRKPLTWHVPVTAQVLPAATGQVLVSGGTGKLMLDGCGPVVVNAGQTGYFRTLYSPKQFSTLMTNFASMSPIDQLGLLSDSWALGLAGLQPIADFLNLANAVPLDANPEIWNKIASVYGVIYRTYAADSINQRQLEFGKYAIARLTPIMNKVSWNAKAEDSNATVNLREQLIDVLGQLGDPLTIAEANRRYAIQTDANYPVALRKVILKVVALHANETTWDKLHVAAQAEKSPLIKNELYGLLASSKDPALATRALNIAITDEPDATSSAAMIGQVASLHPDLAFDFAIANLPKVNKFVDGNSRNRYLPRIASASSNSEMIMKLTAYATEHIPPSARGSTNLAISTINEQIKIRKQRLPAIDAWIAEEKHSDAKVIQ